MDIAASVIIHVTHIDTPVRSEIHLKEGSHPVLLVFMGGKVLEFEPRGKCRCELVLHVSHDDILESCSLAHSIMGILLLHRIEKQGLELTAELFLYIHAEIPVQQVACLRSPLLCESVVRGEIRMYLHAPFASEGRTAPEVVIHVELSAHFSAVPVCRFPELYSIRMEIGQQVCILGADSRHVIQQVCSGHGVVHDFRSHPLQSPGSEVDAQAMIVVSEFYKLGIAPLLEIHLPVACEVRIRVVLLSSVHIFRLEEKSGAVLEIDTPGVSCGTWLAAFILQIHRDVLEPVQYRTFQSEVGPVPFGELGNGEAYVASPSLGVGSENSMPIRGRPHKALTETIPL